MDGFQISDEEKRECIEYMLCNKSLEKTLRNWKRHKSCMDAMFEMLNAFVERARVDGGLIVSVKCDQIPTGAEHVEFFMADKVCELHWAEDKRGRLYVMVFTSKERFQECDDTSGVVMFMDELFIMAEKRKDLDGIIINLEKEEVILDKVMLRIVLWLLEKGKHLK